jgi:hypothetical protein
VRAAPGPYIACMENRYSIRYPTAAELYAVEQEARRLRAAETTRLLRALGRAVLSLFKTKATKVKGLQHA